MIVVDSGQIIGLYDIMSSFSSSPSFQDLFILIMVDLATLKSCGARRTGQ